MAMDFPLQDQFPADEGRAPKRRRVESGDGHTYQTVTDLQKESLVCKQSGRPADKLVRKGRKDDEDGRFNFKLGENLTPRYKIIRKMGQGTFGQVLECWDRDEHEDVAIKIIRSVKKYREAALTEIDVLFKIGEDKMGARGCVQIRRWFEYENHICIVFEKLGPSLFDFLKGNRFYAFNISTARKIFRQLLESVAYLHGLRYIHTDLKPENVLLISSEYLEVLDSKSKWRKPIRIPRSSRVKLIDFGSTRVHKERGSSIVSTRHYRAPEVILGLGWSYPCDIWSLGCILVELVSGKLLFDTHENLEHLAMMERILGPIPRHLILNARGDEGNYFKQKRRLNWPEGASSSESVQVVQKLLRLEDLVAMYAGDCFLHSLIDLLHGLLAYDPRERLTAEQALKHSFFR